ncbi:MAG TPA: hypothetical protein VH598_05145 [Verrucomicrobiae bacterium]|nr:hypothetical protein [Verrucomicrobiae bacterium]
MKATINEAGAAAEEYFTNSSNDLGWNAVKEVRDRAGAGSQESGSVVDQLFTNIRNETMGNRNQLNATQCDRSFKFSLSAPLQTCRSLGAKIAQLKDKLVERLGGEVNDRLPKELFQQAFVEAEALAWSTPYPLLFLPALAEEKVLSAGQWAGRQRQILSRGWKI